MRDAMLAAVGLVALAVGAGADEKKEGGLKQAKAKFDAAVKARQADVDKAPPAFKKELADELKEFIIIETDNLFDVAEQEAESAEAFDVFAQMLVKAADKDKAKKARLLIVQHHLTKPHIKKALPSLASAGDDNVEGLLKIVAEKNEDKGCRGVATLMVGTAAQAAAKLTNGEDKKEKLAKAADWLTRAKEKYADVPHDGSTIGKIATGRLAAVKVAQAGGLEAGKKVPELVGEGLDGKVITLSEANKGKVLMVCCWATWCGPCMAQVPHEVELVEKMKDRPFELIGVNCDDELTEAVRKTIEEKKITWRSFANKRKDAPPVMEEWDLSLPTVLVIDHKGVIKHLQTGPGELDKLDKVIEELVKAAEKEKK
jgi:thiol-disulfide isomerase/thioredoxin